MSQRLRLYDLRLSSFPTDAGLCQGDIAGVAAKANAVQQRLLYCVEAGDEGWWGTWAEMAFNVQQSNPFLTTPREVARLELINICRIPVPINNQFYEYLQFGNGRLPKLNLSLCGNRGWLQVFERNNAPSFFYEVFQTPQQIAIYPLNATDVGKRVLLQGWDPAGNIIRSLDGRSLVQGVFVVLAAPFVLAPQQFSRITGLQKDITLGDVQFFTSDPTSGTQTILTQMEAGEQTAWYRRYYFNRLPLDCCGSSTPSVCTPPGSTPVIEVKAIAKLEPIPVVADPDYLIIQNLAAFIEENKALRYSTLDSPTAKQMESFHHKEAVRYLQGELTHYLGKNEPAVSFKPFGSANLRREKIGSML